MEINLIIRELLAKHDYISLPGLGSFTQKYEPAFPSADGKSFIPPKQVITFDTSRIFNDEAIENYLCDKLGINHAEASNMLKVFVDKVNYNLDKGRPVVFENVGELFKNKKGKVRFEQTPNSDTAISTYGLNTLEVEQVSNKKIVKTKIVKQSTPSGNTGKSSSKILITISIFLGIAAIIAVFVLLPEFRFWEKYIKSNNEVAAQKTDTTKQPSNNITTPIDTTLIRKDSLQEKVDKSIEDKNVKKTALYYEEPKKQDTKLFYIIVGSFGKVENAQKLIDKYKGLGYNPEIIEGETMFRVSINKTPDKSKALSELNKFKSTYPNESAWVLGLPQ